MTTLYVLQTSEQDPSTGGVEFTCHATAETAYFIARQCSPKDGGFGSLIKIYPSNKTASGYSQKTICEYQTGIYNNR